MRLYTFCNYYLSSIQQGIQSAHLVHDMFVDCAPFHTHGARNALFDWARYHKTIVVLNGGNSGDLAKLFVKIKDLGYKLDLPYGRFSEDEASLNNALTCVGIVVPTAVYEFNDEVKVMPRAEYPELAAAALARTMGLMRTHVELAELIKSYPLAR